MLGCKHSHYEGGTGYVCRSKEHKCPYEPPDIEKCINDFKESVKKQKEQTKCQSVTK